MSVDKARPSSDKQLLQIVDSALAATADKSGPWLVCKPGCSQCCVGVFAINQLDVLRLRSGLEELSSRDAGRAANVRRRAVESVSRISPDFPGDPLTGMLHEGAEDSEEFDSFANDEPCPALDPATGTCDLYSARPMTCRVFGPPVRSEGGLGVCELCYQGASEEEIAGCEMLPDPDDLEGCLLDDLQAQTGICATTTVAFVLAHEDGAHTQS